MKVPLSAISTLQNNLLMHKKVLGSRFPFRQKKKKAEHVYHVFLTTVLDRGKGSASPHSCFIAKETDPWVFAE